MSEQNHRKGGRPPKWLTVEIFEKFIHNDFWQLNLKVNISLWLQGFILIIMAITLATVVASAWN